MNLNIDLPGGQADLGNGEQPIRVLGGADTVRQLADTQIMLPGGRFARLGDIADVRDGVGEIRSLDLLQRPRRPSPSGSSRRRTPPMSRCFDGVQKALDEHPQAIPAT